MVHLSFAGRDFVATRQGALFCPVTRALIVADLHLEKASWYARLGQMLPPYDSMATLDTLIALAERFSATSLWCLGDNFHDSDGPARLPSAARRALQALGQRLDLNWIVGNHDSEMTESFGGLLHGEGRLGSIALRHIARPHPAGAEMSGHYHPKLRLTVRGKRVARPCFIRTDDRLILPAFGALTGGLDVDHPAILAISGGGEALIPLETQLLRFPIEPRNFAARASA